MSEDGVETVCIGSIAELEELSGVKAERNGEKDLHRETIDKITFHHHQVIWITDSDT